MSLKTRQARGGMVRAVTGAGEAAARLARAGSPARRTDPIMIDGGGDGMGPKAEGKERGLCRGWGPGEDWKGKQKCLSARERRDKRVERPGRFR